jgi:hypothetical protein
MYSTVIKFFLYLAMHKAAIKVQWLVTVGEDKDYETSLRDENVNKKLNNNKVRVSYAL